MTEKENLLRCIRHEIPQWVPYGNECVVTIWSPVVERSQWKEGFDSFGVHWSFDANAEGGTYPSPGRHPISNLSEWKTTIEFPNLDDFDWDALKKEAESIDRKENLVMGFVEMAGSV